jgi:hypothetical protein
MKPMELFSSSSMRSNLKKGALAVFLAGGFFTMSAMATPRRADNFGMKCGFSLSSLFDSAPFFYASPLGGITGGLFFNFPLGAASFLQGEMNYVVRGFKYLDHRSGDENANFGYLEFPLLLNLSLKRKPGFIFFGPYYAMLFSSQSAAQQIDWMNPGDVLRNWDAGLIAGIRWHFPGIFFELRYTQGLVNIILETEAPSGLQNNYHSNTISLLFGFFI